MKYSVSPRLPGSIGPGAYLSLNCLIYRIGNLGVEMGGNKHPGFGVRVGLPESHPTILPIMPMCIVLEDHHRWVSLVETDCLRCRNLLKTFVITTGSHV